MGFRTIIFESPRAWHAWLIMYYLKLGHKIYVAEPFYAYHHEKRTRFFPPPLPARVMRMVRDGRVSLLKAESLQAKEIYYMASERAVAVAEKVFVEYRKDHGVLIGYVCRTLGSASAESIFKKMLCNKLAVFYSVDEMLSRFERVVTEGELEVYADTNIFLYRYLNGLVSRSGEKAVRHPRVSFLPAAYISGFIENLRSNIASTCKLCGQLAASHLLGRRVKGPETQKKRYKFAFTIVGPMRQLVGNGRGPDFIVDNQKIHYAHIVYIPLQALHDKYRSELERLPGNIFYPPDRMRYFSNPSAWRGLFSVILRARFWRTGTPALEACMALAVYFVWKKAMTEIEVEHFITHADFGISHIARNIALKEAGVSTWYFTDSINSAVNLRKDLLHREYRHPFWTYLYYDHFVTWDEMLAGYYSEHPGTDTKAHIIGCLWAQNLIEKEAAMAKLCPMLTRDIPLKNRFIIAAFDSTYSDKNVGSYEEGIKFAHDLLKIVDEDPDIVLLIKEKKRRDFYIRLNTALGRELIMTYEKFDNHPRVVIFHDGMDASLVMSSADIIISFPFTSTTFEALSVDKPAVWHDPLGCYRNTVYGNIEGITTHGYEELKKKILEVKRAGLAAYKTPIPQNSPLMDPYRDGKAIERFREILVTS